MKKLAVMLAMTTALSLVAGCSSQVDNGNDGAASESDAASLALPASEVIADRDGSGVETSRRLFETAEIVVVSGPELAEQTRAAHVAIAAGAPMITAVGADNSTLEGEITRLQADTVVTVGQVGALATTAELIDDEQSLLPESIEDIAVLTPETASGIDDLGFLEHPLTMPPMLATAETTLASLSTAKAAGAEVMMLPYPDPRISPESMDLVNNSDVLALGAQFGDPELFDRAVDLAANGELPGGGGLVFPGRRMIALYGHPSGAALGVMGEQSPDEAVTRAQELVAQYQPLEEQPVIPAFEVIATVASDVPGPDGNYSNESDPEELRPYVEAITQAGGYANLDLQPGQGSFLEQAKYYEDLLKLPNVGLALDPEWKLAPGEQPMTRVGNTTAAEINEVSEWLATLVQDNDLPQKSLIVHQFQTQMVRNRELIDTSYPEIAFVLHVDGHGGASEKFDTWGAMQQDLSGDFFLAWKNFIDEDTPMFTPEQTFSIEPRPWFVSYQ
ncbi:cell wall-binding repeat-containing protein [Corynebacterium alimapuense]|uniref:Cell wall-binding repeat 2 family protein n=1 Tax=Corynebacterium alimapuense TaxID=1576874 RepID=A0A3M8K6Z9_9CORY|nr:cell wall-binding repeat-containing protein [Corynebacterium alimapuense]RNE48342.1 cell wall-binding repeat 2 family protein [Corynebacterium alimapuense]